MILSLEDIWESLKQLKEYDRTFSGLVSLEIFLATASLVISANVPSQKEEQGRCLWEPFLSQALHLKEWL